MKIDEPKTPFVHGTSLNPFGEDEREYPPFTSASLQSNPTDD